MLNKYKKQEAPSWQRNLVLLLGALCGAIFLFFIDWARVDDCLDKGGSYDYELGECDFESNHTIPDD